MVVSTRISHRAFSLLSASVCLIATLQVRVVAQSVWPQAVEETRRPPHRSTIPPINPERRFEVIPLEESGAEAKGIGPSVDPNVTPSLEPVPRHRLPPIGGPSADGSPAPDTAAPTATPPNLTPSEAFPLPQPVLLQPLPPSTTSGPHSPSRPPGFAPGFNPQVSPQESFPFDPPPLDQTYVLTTGDRLGVIFVNIPEYSGEYQVQVDGSLNLPVVGSLSVWGLTLAQASRAIAQRYEQLQILRRPTVTVTLLLAAPLRVAILGEVNRPGVYVIPPIDGTGVMPLLSGAIQQAGGITQQTNLQDIKVKRRQRSGQPKILSANLWKLLSDGDIQQDLTLRDGDVISLTTAPPDTISQAIALGSSNLAPTAIQIGILGEVKQSGAFQVPPTTSLNQVLLSAGGFTDRARHKVTLIRLQTNGTVEQREIKIDWKNHVNPETNPLLQNRDVILVEATGWSRFADRVNTVLAPFSNTVNAITQPFSSIINFHDIFQVFRNLFRPNLQQP